MATLIILNPWQVLREDTGIFAVDLRWLPKEEATRRINETIARVNKKHPGEYRIIDLRPGADR